MPSVRPILDQWRSTPWVAKTPIDDTPTDPGTPIGELLQRQVHIGITGDGPMGQRHLQPLTPAATEWMHGPHRTSVDRVLRGMLSTLDGTEGVNNLRGISLSTDQGAFATNLLMSNMEAGFFPDSVTANDPAGFERSMVQLIPSVKVAKAQNTGWLDFGPRVSDKVYDMAASGPRAATADDKEVALTTLHEFGHNVTPPDPNTISDKHVWLEEGIAETLAWWPGRAGAMLERMGTPLRAGDIVDPYSVAADSTASLEYRNRHRAVLGLLGLAGVSPYAEDGTIDVEAGTRAQQLLQGDEIERVPRNLARAIVAHQGVDDALTGAVQGLVEDVAGDPEAVTALSDLLRSSRGRTTG
ncbi:MAG: hypothetical protein JWO69_198 [Thermoleophilia bacterium]|jgi:hypothetical protein|nr:hypothetical protein [Thermoleophilia bacterium]